MCCPIFFFSLLLHLNCKVINKPLVKGKRKREKKRESETRCIYVLEHKRILKCGVRALLTYTLLYKGN